MLHDVNLTCYLLVLTLTRRFDSSRRCRRSPSTSTRRSALVYKNVFKTELYSTISAKVNRYQVLEDKALKNLTAVTTNKSSTSKQIQKATLKHTVAKDQTSAVRASLSQLGAKYNFLGMFLTFLTYRYLSSKYYGISIGRLPFEPPYPINRLTSRGLTDLPSTSLSFFFIYMLINFGLKR